MIDVRRIEGTTFIIRISEDIGDELFWSAAEEIMTEALISALQPSRSAAHDRDDNVPF